MHVYTIKHNNLVSVIKSINDYFSLTVLKISEAKGKLSSYLFNPNRSSR